MNDSDNNPYQSDLDVEEYYQTAISKFSKEKIDAYHRLTRDSIKDIDSEYVQEGFGGLEYRRFIKLHFYMQSSDDLLRSIASNYAAFNLTEREAAKAILKMYDQYAIDPNFWRTDTGQVLKEMSESFEKMLKAKHCKIENKMKFNLFHLVSNNLAVIALHDKELRKIARIRKSWFLRP